MTIAQTDGLVGESRGGESRGGGSRGRGSGDDGSVGGAGDGTESTRRTIGDEVDAALRADVRLLGELLGRVLTEAGGAGSAATTSSGCARSSIDAYEARRRRARARRRGARRRRSPPSRAEQVARAFTCYFHLVEPRRGAPPGARAASRDAEAGGRRRLAARGAVGRLDRRGRAPRRPPRRLRALRFHPVLTAHPTEARRRAVASAHPPHRRPARRTRRRRARHAPAAVEIERRLLEEIDVLWRTSPLRTTRPTPLDEVRTAMSVFDQTLFEVVPHVYRLLDDRLLGDGGRPSSPVRAPAFLRLGQLDRRRPRRQPVRHRRGHPRRPPRIASEHVLLGLDARRDPRRPHAHPRRGRHPAVAPICDALRERRRAISPRPRPRRSAPARRTSRTAACCSSSPARIAATRTRRRRPRLRRARGAARRPARRPGLARAPAGARRSANGELQNLVWQVETFGFHLAELEVRQHSQVHRDGAGRGLARRRASRADMTRRGARRVPHHRRRCRSRFGVGAVAPLHRLVHAVVGRHRRPSTSWPTLALGSAEAAPVLDVIPLFETFADLEATHRHPRRA